MLKPRKRLTKKQLKEDKLVTFYMNASTWIENNSKYLFGGIIGVVVLVGALLFYSNSLKKSEAAASVELARAIRTYQSQDYKGALTALSTIVENYGSSQSGKIALLYLANSFYYSQDYDNALKQYKKFISKYSKSDHLLTFGMGGVASCLEQKAQYDEAAKQYVKTVNKYSDSIMAPNYLIRAARCFELAGNKDMAKSNYQRVISTYPDTREKDEAIMLMAAL